MRQVCGRFIQDEQPIVMLGAAASDLRQAPGDRDQSPLGHGQIADPGFWRDVQTDLIQQGAHRGPLVLPQDAARQPGAEPVDPQVLHDRHGRHQRQILVDERHPGSTGPRPEVAGDVPPAHMYGDARVCRVETGQDLDERRFSRPVLADQRTHLSSALCE